MTEAEWLSCRETAPMLLFLRGRSARKRRLFACACCRRIWRRLKSHDHRLAVETAEDFADGKADEDLRSALVSIVEGSEDDEMPDPDSPRFSAEVAAYWAIASDEDENIAENLDDPATEDCAILSARSASFAVSNPPRESAEQCKLLRCIFGNPFHPVEFDPNWLTSTVRELAATAYESREFGTLPVLADALQDAGCDDETVLGHLRGPGPHARGCWVLDAILGKQ